MYYQMNRLSRSAATYEKALEKFPSFLRARKNLGFVYLSLGKIEDASESLSRAISLGENDGATYVALGYCLFSQERYVSAENAYRMGSCYFPKARTPGMAWSTASSRREGIKKLSPCSTNSWKRNRKTLFVIKPVPMPCNR